MALRPYSRADHPISLVSRPLTESGYVAAVIESTISPALLTRPEQSHDVSLPAVTRLPAVRPATLVRSPSHKLGEAGPVDYAEVPHNHLGGIIQNTAIPDNVAVVLLTSSRNPSRAARYLETALGGFIACYAIDRTREKPQL